MKTNNKINIGFIDFTNCLPINYALEKFEEENLIFRRGYPALINEFMRTGQVFAAPMSSIEYLQNKKDYILLKSGCITSDAECGSVILFSNHKFEDLSEKNIAIPHDSATSIAMLKVLLKEKGVDLNSIKFSTHKYESEVDKVLQNYDAVLEIGDAALVSRFKYENKCFDSSEFYSYDLGTVWKETTGLSPVFGVWAARAEWANLNQDSFDKINLLISKAVDAGLGVYFNEAVELAAEKLNLPQEYIKDYLTAKIKYEFTEEQEKSLLLFEQLYKRLENL